MLQSRGDAEPRRRYDAIRVGTERAGLAFKPLEAVLLGMSVSGLCQICESRPAQHQCPNCGAFVCELHYDDELGLCADCAAQARPGRPEDVDINRF
ncbi:hypothetical protein [Natrinema gelatinilyticum]|uniref:hypothetical protein n=1 Tax=Natrinema gelatinilyticum TaxID=2961571 RepID=UPI0020C26EA3|nr:hypothetical protein [Natrinema gelatinilyticum]